MKARVIVLVIAALAALGYLAFMFSKGDGQAGPARSESPATSGHTGDAPHPKSPAESSPPVRFVTQEAFEKNLQSQVSMAPQTLEQLRSLGVTDKSRLKFEFFFFTNSDQKAAALAEVLKKRGYDVRHGASGDPERPFLITGWTDKMALDDATVVAWTREMCQLGFESDCQFDGWGTNPVPE